MGWGWGVSGFNVGGGELGWDGWDGYTVAHFEADVGPVDGGGRGWGEGGHFGCLDSILY